MKQDEFNEVVKLSKEELEEQISSPIALKAYRKRIHAKLIDMDKRNPEYDGLKAVLQAATEIEADAIDAKAKADEAAGTDDYLRATKEKYSDPKNLHPSKLADLARCYPQGTFPKTVGPKVVEACRQYQKDNSIGWAAEEQAESE